MKPDEVKRRVTDDSIWKNAVWVNESNKIFFVPIWRNGSTTFMNHIAAEFDFELIADSQLDDYLGFTFLRDPMERFPSQVVMASKNTGMSYAAIIEHMHDEIDEHMRTQSSFLGEYHITYYIDLKNKKLTGDKFIDSILTYMHGKHAFATAIQDKKNVIELVNAKYSAQVNEYISDDKMLYDAVIR